MLTSWFGVGGAQPGQLVVGESTMIRVRVTETTWASAPLKVASLVPVPNLTCTGASKPSPLMMTWVPPSFGPEDGVTEKTVGWSVPPPPPLV